MSDHEPTEGPVGLCCCDGAAFETKKHPFIVNDSCPIHGTPNSYRPTTTDPSAAVTEPHSTEGA